jgi:hypothetical protein
MLVADITGKRWVGKTHIHMAERRFGILGCRRAAKVYAWLGEADPQIDCVFDILQEDIAK